MSTESRQVLPVQLGDVANPKQSTGPRRIVQSADFVGRGAAAPIKGAPAPILVNHGGPVLGSVEVVPIYWGNAWANGGNATLSTQLDEFFDFILTSSLIDLLKEYSTSSTQIGRGRRLQSVRVTNNEPGTQTTSGRQVTDAQIQQSLQAWIKNGTVPASTADTLYFIYLPPNVNCLANGSQSCAGFCGYHDHVDSTYYAVVPYVNCNGCTFPGNFLNTLTEVSSHELCEAITDPALNKWWDPNTFGTGPGGR